MPSVANDQSGGVSRSGREALAGCAFYAVGAVMVLILPLYIGLMAESLGLTPGELGALASAEASGGVVASLAGPLWIGRANWRLLSACSLAVMVGGAILTPFAPDFVTLLILRLVTSIFGAGVIYTLGVALLSRTKLPDRNFAIAGGVQALVPAAILLAGPMLAAAYGPKGPLFLLAGLFALTFFVLWAVPGRSIAPEPNHFSSSDRPPALKAGSRQTAFLLLFSALLLTAATNAYWAFAERVGEAGGLASGIIGAWLATSAVVAVPAAAATAFLAARYGRELLFLVGSIAFAAGLLIVLPAITQVTFAASVILLFFFSVFLTPFQFGALAEADQTDTNSLVVLAPAAQSIGVMAGPFVAGAFIHGDGFVVSSIVAVVFLAAAWVTFQAGVARLNARPSGNTKPALVQISPES